MLLIFGLNLLIALVTVASLLGVSVFAFWIFEKLDYSLMGLISASGILASLLAIFLTLCQYLDK